MVTWPFPPNDPDGVDAWRYRSLEEVDPVLAGRLVAHFAPPLVVAVLFPPARVAARRLDVAVGRRANPHVRVSRWNGEPFDPEQPGFIADQCSRRQKTA